MRNAKHIKMTKREWHILKRKEFRELYGIIKNHAFFSGAAYLPPECNLFRKATEKLKDSLRQDWKV